MNIELKFVFETSSEGINKAVALLEFADKLGASAVGIPPPVLGAPTPAAKPKAPAPAPAKGKAAAPPPKTNSKAKPEPRQPDIMDFAGDNDEDDDQTGGLELADDDGTEEADFDGTPEEAKEEALAKLRTMLGNGLKTQVKEVQTIMKVAKFHDVPAEEGFAFLAAVKKVEAKLGKN